MAIDIHNHLHFPSLAVSWRLSSLCACWRRPEGVT